MKKLFFVSIALILGIGTLNAKKKKENNPLVGVWQLCTQTSNRVIGVPIFKIVNADGTYMAITGGNRIVGAYTIETQTAISQQGRYEIKNDSIYHEQIDKHYLSRDMENTTTVLKYSFSDSKKNILLQEFTNEITGIKVKELWRRVTPLNL